MLGPIREAEALGVRTKTRKAAARPRPARPAGDARLRALTEHALEIITVQDATGRFTYANEAVVQELGYTTAEMMGRNAADFLHPDDVEAMRERFRNILASKDGEMERNRFEYRFRRRDGNWCWLESVAVNALANPAVLGIIAHSRDITRRKLSEHNLLLNHARYRTVAELSEGAVHEYIMNAAGVYELVWALGTERVYGCNENEYRRRGWASFHVSEGWKEESLARTRRYLAGETVEFTVQIRRTDGQLRWVDVRNRPIADPATGKFSRLVGVVTDVTERKLAADALRESEFRYRTVAELTSGFVYEATVDEQGETQVVWASPGLESFFGGSFEELNRLGWRHVFFAQDHDAAIERRKRLRLGERTQLELALKTLKGDKRWIHLANQPIIDFDGNITRYIGVVHDITDRKADEEVLRSQALALEVMREGVALSDSGGIIRMSNPAFDRMFGMVTGSLIGKHLSHLPCYPALDRRIAESADGPTASTGAPLVSELTVRGARDGEGTLFVEATITSLVLRGERFFLTMLQDATARRQLEREVLEASNREQQRIGNDLHDGLGQELTGIALLLRGLENRAEREATTLSPAIEEVALLVNDAIFTTRALARGLTPVTFDRGGLALALEELARRLSAMFHINVLCEADDSLERGLESVNALHLYRIAQEAVTNAAQHGSAGQVQIVLRRDGERGLLRIEDNGGGFNPSHQSKGLGLRIMHYRAQMMAGSLRIESGRSRGTIISCWFPR
jgi:PAS domain S-box-containing protein